MVLEKRKNDGAKITIFNVRHTRNYENLFFFATSLKIGIQSIGGMRKKTGFLNFDHVFDNNFKFASRSNENIA